MTTIVSSSCNANTPWRWYFWQSVLWSTSPVERRFSWLTYCLIWLATTWTSSLSVSYWVRVAHTDPSGYFFFLLEGYIDLILFCITSSLTDSSVCTGNLCWKVWPNNRRLIQKGEYPLRWERPSGMSWLLAAALDVYVMMLCCLFSSELLLSVSFPFFSFHLSLHESLSSSILCGSLGFLL